MSELEPTRTYSNHTANDELRRLLDERGVEWRDDSSIYGTRRTVWTANGVTYVAAEVSGRLKVSGYLTPAQAVEATLGRGTCRMEKRHMDWRCTGCGEIVGTDDPTSELFIDGNAVELWHYCPNCGWKVVDV